MIRDIYFVERSKGSGMDLSKLEKRLYEIRGISKNNINIESSVSLIDSKRRGYIIIGGDEYNFMEVLTLVTGGGYGIHKHITRQK